MRFRQIGTATYHQRIGGWLLPASKTDLPVNEERLGQFKSSRAQSEPFHIYVPAVNAGNDPKDYFMGNPIGYP